MKNKKINEKLQVIALLGFIPTLIVSFFSISLGLSFSIFINLLFYLSIQTAY